MWQKILDYPFKSGSAPFDASGFNNHGVPTAISPGFDGVEPGSGVFGFNGKTSQIHVPHNESWNDLVAVRVDALVKSDLFGIRQTIVEGDYSFSLWIRQDLHVAATFLSPGVMASGGSPDPFDTEAAAPSPPGLGPAPEWIGISTHGKFAPDGEPRRVKPHEWVRILFVHDGISMQLYLDGVLAAYRSDIQTLVPGVQSAGVLIGRGQTTHFGFKGVIDHIRIWKFDPYVRQHRFFCRKMESHTEACWRDLLVAIVRARNDEKTSADVEKVLICVQKAEDRLMRAVQSQGQPAMQQAANFARQYQELWCRGDIDSGDLCRLIGEWSEWMTQDVGDAYYAYLAEIMTCLPALKKTMPELASRLTTCDPAFRGLMRCLCEGMPATQGSPHYGDAPGGDRYTRRHETQKQDHHLSRDYRDSRTPPDD
jgi:hypothetical protein